jgi:hypothetical protein
MRQPLIFLALSLISALPVPAIAGESFLVAQVPPDSIQFGQLLPIRPVENYSTYQRPVYQPPSQSLYQHPFAERQNFGILGNSSTYPESYISVDKIPFSEAQSYPFYPAAAYGVEVVGDSAALLQAVRQIVPTAVAFPKAGIIQVGSFNNTVDAEEQVRRLAGQGIAARIVNITGRAGISALPQNANSYFAIVPSSRQDLQKLTARITQLGISPTSITTREVGLGTHIAVGPFFTKVEAERWSSYLRSYGMDSRVYFGN